MLLGALPQLPIMQVTGETLPSLDSSGAAVKQGLAKQRRAAHAHTPRTIPRKQWVYRPWCLV